MPEPVDPHHLLLIGAGPGVGASVVRRFGREGFRGTLISRGKTLDQLAPELRGGGLQIEAIAADIEDLGGYRETIERIFSAPGAPGVVVYNAALPDPGHCPALGQTLIAAGVRADGIHAATVTIAGTVKPGTDFAPDRIAELFWTAHTDPKDAWQTEYRLTGA
jgi:NAD(P)-dependent dehydrogenase (short-subunit alcohol dehydrogenase family)